MKTGILLALLLLVPGVLADSDTGHESFPRAEEILDQQVPCEELSESDLEELGDYYMEQMHPGEAHERMDAMMGGEGTEELRQAHVSMGIRGYCGTDYAPNMVMDHMGGVGSQAFLLQVSFLVLVVVGAIAIVVAVRRGKKT